MQNADCRLQNGDRLKAGLRTILAGLPVVVTGAGRGRGGVDNTHRSGNPKGLSSFTYYEAPAPALPLSLALSPLRGEGKEWEVGA